jgi:hypothetical protein
MPEKIRQGGSSVQCSGSEGDGKRVIFGVGGVYGEWPGSSSSVVSSIMRILRRRRRRLGGPVAVGCRGKSGRTRSRCGSPCRNRRIRSTIPAVSLACRCSSSSPSRQWFSNQDQTDIGVPSVVEAKEKAAGNPAATAKPVVLIYDAKRAEIQFAIATQIAKSFKKNQRCLLASPRRLNNEENHCPISGYYRFYFELIVLLNNTQKLPEYRDGTTIFDIR